MRVYYPACLSRTLALTPPLRATGVVYVCLGFGTSAWLSRLPDVRDNLGLTPATIGTMLLIASLGSLLTLPTSGPIVTKIGARASGRIGVAIWALGIVCAGIGALDVSDSAGHSWPRAARRRQRPVGRHHEH